MKELSVEEKAERYDEALKVAKSNYETIVQMDKDCTFAKEGIVNTFHHIFPELEESEDERIREEIINYFQCQSRDEPTRKDIHNKWLAWLEKQGEQAKIEALRTEYEKGRADVIAEMQKLAWSEEDKNIIDRLLSLCEETQDNFQQLSSEFSDIEELKDWLKSLRPQKQWKPTEEQLKQLGKYCPDNTALTALYEQLKKLREE